MKLFRLMGMALLATLLLAAIIPVGAQDDEVPVLILPIDLAQFLPGAMFDFRVEVHAAEMPENFSISINGEDAAAFFGAEATEESWEFGGNVVRFNNEGAIPADFAVEMLVGSFYNANFGQLDVTVTDGVISAGEGVTLEPTDDPAIFNIIGGAGDGLAATLGFNADGELTGVDIGGLAQFGILAGALPTKSQSVIWRGVMLPEAGDYTVEVTAAGTTREAVWTAREPMAGTARNVILFIADGMTVPMITAARIASRGIVQGTLNDNFYMDGAEAIGLAHTSSVDSLMADSANTLSSVNTGHIGSVNSTGSYSDTSPNRLDDPRTETFAEIIQRTRGLSVGVVTTSDWSDATPAAVWAHGRDRGDANRAAYVVQALDAGIDVIMGGGARRMLPNTAEGSRRSDDRDMFAEFEGAGYTIVTTATELDAAMGELPEQLLGVFTPSDLNVWLDRNVYTDNLGDFTDQPGLVDMTVAALDILNQNENGFYLEVEAASVDKQMHPLDQERALSDLIEFDFAVGAALEWAAENAPDTLIIVTADHGHGYEVYGTVDVERFNAATDDAGRIAAIGIYNGAGYPTYTDEDGDGFPNWEASRVFAGTVNNHPAYSEDFQVSPIPRAPSITNESGANIDNPDDDPNGLPMNANVPGGSGVHTLQDVPVFAFGPGAENIMGIYHQRDIFFHMAAGIGLNPAAEDGMISVAAPETAAAGFDPSLLAIVGAGLAGGFVIGRARRK